MLRPRPSRLRAFDYCGLHRYHVRAATWNRAPHFTEGHIVRSVSEQVLQQAAVHSFDVLAYCFMPEHAHLLVTGRAENAHLRRFLAARKQQSGYQFARSSGSRLWQPGYFDRVLRDEETSEAAARYIVANPVRAGLAARVGEYPHAWCLWGVDMHGHG